MASARVCTSCAAENPAGARFCISCGTALERSCPACGTPAPEQARFCPACGSALDAAGAEPEAGRALGVRLPLDGAARREAVELSREERRTVTVLFADLSGYTAISETLDPEAVKALVDRCLSRLAEEVTRVGGHVDKYIGDNVMAVFGAPVAHEDDPERAVRAALGMQDAMGELNERLLADYRVEFALRIGVNTGEVLAGTVGEAYTVIGDAVNVASRMQASASPGTITVGERTHRATSGMVEYAPLEPLSLKGKAEPVPAWRALRLLVQPTGGARVVRQQAPLVGRAEELSALSTLVGRVARMGAPQLITVFGQAGVGKSRLLREFERALAAREKPVLVRGGRCLPFGSSIVYWPLSEMVRAECSIAEGDPSELAWQKLSGRLAPLLAPDGDEELVRRRIAPIAQLVGIELPGAEDPGRAREEEQSAREAFFGGVRAFVEAIAQDEPLVLAWEDIHWADEGMLDLIEYLSQWLRTPVLQVCLARDELLERRPSWAASRRTSTSLFLDPLAPADMRELIAALLTENGPAAADVLETLAERAEGNPLFAEEMVQRLAEEGSTRAAELPDTVQGLLAARLDSLAPFERQLVAHAAVVGRTFWEGALVPVAAAEGGDLQAALASLREKDI